jgi:hypothetical protein
VSRYGEIIRPLGAEQRTFRLGLGEVRAIEEKCDAGLPELVGRLAPVMQLRRLEGAAPGDRQSLLWAAIAQGAFGRWRVDDYREPIYRGLIGGGETPTMAGAIVMAEVDDHEPLPFCLLAIEIMMAVLMPPDDEALGEKNGATTARPSKPRSRARKPAGRRSTAPAR